jgi:SSS family transporter
LTTTIIVFILYFLVMLGIGFFSFRNTNDEKDYWIAGGNLGWAIGGASIASTQMSAGLFIGTIGIMHTVGWSFGWVVLVFPISYWFMVAVIAPKFTKVKKNTLPDFIETRYYSKSARVIAAIIILVTFIVYIQAQIVAGGLIANIVFGIPSEQGMILFTIILLVYCVIGGMMAVMYTDFIQMMVMIFGAVIAVPLAIRHFGNIGDLFAYTQAVKPFTFTWDGMPPAMLFTLGLAFLLGAVARPEQLVRFYTMKDMKTIRKGILFTIILVGVAHFFVFFLSLTTPVLFPALPTGDLAMPMLASAVLPSFIGAILLAAVASAMMSTVDSVLLVAGSALSHDIYQPLINQNASEKKKIWVGRIGVVISGVVPVVLLLLGVGKGELVQMMVALFSALMASCFLMPVVLGVLWKRTTKEGAIASMIGGLLAAFTWKMLGYDAIVDPVVAGFVISTLLIVGVSLLTPRPPESALSPFFDEKNSSIPTGTPFGN